MARTKRMRVWERQEEKKNSAPFFLSFENIVVLVEINGPWTEYTTKMESVNLCKRNWKFVESQKWFFGFQFDLFEIGFPVIFVSDAISTRWIRERAARGYVLIAPKNLFNREWMRRIKFKWPFLLQNF